MNAPTLRGASPQASGPLPDGWLRIRLDHACEPRLEKGHEGSRPYVEIGDIDITRKTYSISDKPAVKGAIIAKSGDVLVSRVRPTRGAVCIMREPTATVSSALSVFTPKPELLPEYIFYSLAWNNDFATYLGERCTGTMYPTVSRDVVCSYQIPVSPLREQRRIVAEIEKQFTRLEAGVAALRRVQANLHRYRAAVLKAACEGRLVPTEAETRKTFETGAQLLQRILKQRREQWSGQGQYKQTTSPNTTGLPKLPEGWCWAGMRQVGEVQLGRQRAPQHHSGDNMRPYLRVANVFEARIDTGDIMSMNFTPVEFEKYCLRYGDILLNEGQTPELVGRPAMYRDEIPGCCYQKTLLRFRAYEGLLPHFALTVFRSYMHNRRFTRAASITTNIAHLTAEKFVEIEFPLPPLAEQERIVAEVERRLSVVEELSALVTANLQRATRLRQAILQQAFEGKLVKAAT